MSFKSEEQTKTFDLHFDIFQPWSTFVMGTTLPPEILEQMIKITDEIVSSNKKSDSDNIRPAQIEDQFYLNRETLNGTLIEFFLEICKLYTTQAFCQTDPFNTKNWSKEKFTAHIGEMWMVCQKDNEYNPMHFHGGSISAIMYLKIPEYLPNRKALGTDGQILFTHNFSKDNVWGVGALPIKPKVGDFFIFPSSLMHTVYPFRTMDGKGERRSVSFNAEFSPHPKKVNPSSIETTLRSTLKNMDSWGVVPNIKKGE